MMRPYLLFLGVAASVLTYNGGEILQAAEVCSFEEGLLEIKPVTQEEDVWCFAASSNEVINHLGISDPQSHTGNFYSQCRLFNIAKSPGFDCCSVSHPSGIQACLQRGWPEEIFDKLNPKILYDQGGALDWSWIKAQICPERIHPGVREPGQPFIYVANPAGDMGIPHTYTVKGYSEIRPTGQKILHVDSHSKLGEMDIGGASIDYDCYAVGDCPETMYVHGGDYYNMRKAGP